MRVEPTARAFGATALVALLIVAAAPALARAAEPTFLPGARVGIVPPAGMTPTSRGFEDRKHQAAIVITELSAQTYARVAQEFTAEALKSQGFEVTSRETVALKDGQALLVAARQQVEGVAMRKWALLVPANDLTAIVIALVPASQTEAYPDAAVRDALGTVTLRGKLPPEELLAVLPYAIRDLGGFRLLRASPEGLAVMTFGPADTSLPAEQPYVMVAIRSAEIPAAAQQESFARGALAPFVSMGEFRVTRSGPLRIGGRPGQEIVGEARDTRAEVDLMVVQWLRFGASGHVQMLGMARKNQWDAVFPRMRTLRDAIEPR